MNAPANTAPSFSASVLAFEREITGVCLAFPAALDLLQRRLPLDYFTGSFRAILTALAGVRDHHRDDDHELLGAVWGALVAQGSHVKHDVREADLHRLAAFGAEHGTCWAIEALVDRLVDARERALIESLAASSQMVARDPAANVRVEAQRLAAAYAALGTKVPR
jgi:hypothetical protein